jgi:GAF domain-containing protein
MSLVGRLEDLALSDIFQILSIGKKTGTLILRGSRGSALITFKNGLVVRAETDDIDRTLGEDLVRAGIIKDTIFNLASEVKRKLPSKTCAEILYDFGSVNRDTLEKMTRKRIEKVIYQLLFWQDGDFQFELDDTAPEGKLDVRDLGWELAKGMSPEYLLMEGARVQDESTQTGLVSGEELAGLEKEEEVWQEDWDIQQPVERKDISSLRALTQELRFPNSASEITLLILRFASEIFQRGVLFMVGDTEIVGLGQFGLDIERADEKIREISLPYEQSDFLKKVIGEKRPRKGAVEKDDVTVRMMEEIGEGWPNESAFFPIITEDKVVALLYCDNLSTEEKTGETEGLEIFIDQAGLALEKSLLQRRLHEMEKE